MQVITLAVGLFAIYGQLVLCQDDDGTSTGLAVRNSTSGGEDYEDLIEFFDLDNDGIGGTSGDPMMKQCTLLMQRYGYSSGSNNITYSQDGCELKCFGNGYNEQYYTTSYPNSGILSVTTTYEVRTAVNDMQKCGEDMKCFKGTCMQTMPQYRETCEVNTGNTSIALQNSNDCSVMCVSRDNTTSPYNYGQSSYYYGYNVPKLIVTEIPMPTRYPCGDNGWCNEKGHCLPQELFPSCSQ